MKKLIAVLTMLFAFTFLSAAQTSSAPGSTDQPAGGAKPGAQDQAAGEHTAHKKGAGGGGTLTGCLSGPNQEGAYELKSGSKEVEVGGLDDLSKHVGHKVRLHGSWVKSGSEIGEKENESAEKKESKEKEQKGERHFKVASIDHVADTCTAGAAEKGEHKKGSEPSAPPKF